MPPSLTVTDTAARRSKQVTTQTYLRHTVYMCVYTTTRRRPTLSGSGTGGGASVSAAAPLPVRPRPQSTDNVTMNQSKLIKLVRDYTYLYDLTDKRYCDHTLKEEAWSEIAKQLDSKGEKNKLLRRVASFMQPESCSADDTRSLWRLWTDVVASRLLRDTCSRVENCNLSYY